MILSTNRTALLIFTRTAANEARQKAMLGKNASQNKNLSLAQSLISRAKALGHASGLDVVFCSDLHQKGETFGSRLAHAFNETYAKGYSSVIAIGSDTPALNINHIKAAAKALGEEQTVLGPSSDGGVYLIGLHRKAFCNSTFEHLPWQTDSLYRTFLNTIAGQVCSLQKLSDIDNYHGLFLAYNQLRGNDTIKRLIACLVLYRATFFSKSLSSWRISLYLDFLRGPPLAI